MKQKKLEDIYFACMRELYQNSIGLDGKPGDFDYLLESANLNERGEMVIPFMEYYIPLYKFQEIVDKHIPKKASKYDRYSLKNSIYLGASPTSCKERWEEKKNLKQ